MGRLFGVLLVLLGTALTAPQSPARADWDQFMPALDRDDYKAALPDLLPLAELGNSAAQALLGAMYDNGQGVP